MKILIMILLSLGFSLNILAQEPVTNEPYFNFQEEKKIYKFPDGYSPDGRIGTFNIILLGGGLNQGDNLSGYLFSGRIEFLAARDWTLFFQAEYSELDFRMNSRFIGGGIKFFTGQ